VVKLQYAFEARDDLKNIYSYIAADSVLNAKRFVQSLKLHAEILKSHPEIGNLVYPGRFQDLRQLLYKSYRIIYHYSAGTVTVITIHHQSRLLENITSISNYRE
jgi:addiction module RelE/StbE family toxin